MALAAIAAFLAVQVAAGADGHELAAVVYGIDSTPNGGFVVTQNGSVMEVRDGQVRHMAEIPTAHSETGGPFGTEGTAPVSGVAAIGTGNLFVTSGGLDEGQGSGLWRVSNGNARLVADIESFAHATDADATEGEQWKDHLCELADGWTAGPQTNAYQLTALSGSETLIADAAGNTLLHAKTNGDIDWVAVFPPAYDPTVPEDAPEQERWLVQHDLDAGDVLWDGTELAEDLTCYVQPVPTAVEVGPDGDYYVTELSGTTKDAFVDPQAALDLVGLARVWRIDAGARNVTCPSAACEMVADGLTAVVDAEFGPDGRLYVVEMDRNGWIAAAIYEDFAGGTIKACDVQGDGCEVVSEGMNLFTPSAITFDRHGELWVVDSMFFEPQIRHVALD